MRAANEYFPSFDQSSHWFEELRFTSSFLKFLNAFTSFNAAEMWRLNWCLTSGLERETTSRKCGRSLVADSSVEFNYFNWIRHGRKATYEPGLLCLVIQLIQGKNKKEICSLSWLLKHVSWTYQTFLCAWTNFILALVCMVPVACRKDSWNWPSW